MDLVPPLYQVGKRSQNHHKHVVVVVVVVVYVACHVTFYRALGLLITTHGTLTQCGARPQGCTRSSSNLGTSSSLGIATHIVVIERINMPKRRERVNRANLKFLQQLKLTT